IIPGSYGTDLTGVSDFVPSGSDDLLLWLHAFALEDGAEPVELQLEPRSGGRPGSDLIVAAVTVFNGSASPLVRSPRGQVRLEGTTGERPEIDLGTVIRSRPVRRPSRHGPSASAARIIGWGTPRLDPDIQPGGGAGEGLVVDLAFAPDAILSLGDWPVAARDLVEGRPIEEPGGHRSIELLSPARIPVEVEVVDQLTGERLPARVQFATPDGRYLPPRGHRDEVNPGFFEDTGGDLILGGSTYAYVPGRFEIDLPVGEVEVEVVTGFDRPPIATTISIEPSTRNLELALAPRLRLAGDGRWISADSHVHFLAPSTALLQAAAEDVDLVNLLAAQWGDLFTNVTDLPWGSMADPDGRRIIVVGTENRQNQLGHLALLGAHRPTNPLASGGPPEGRLAGALEVLLADWADRCRAAGGLVVAAHFPLPYAEIAADIVSGRIDAVETQALSPGLDDPSVLEWYRFLNLGYRLPLVAGTDKMTAEVPIGAVRAYTHLLSEEPLTFAAWATAVRAGRTFVSSGPLLELSVEGREPGAVIQLPSAGRLEVGLRARSAQAVLNELELVVNGRVVASTGGAAGLTELRLDESIEVRAGSWIAGRVRSRVDLQSAFTTAMAAHTSAVYVEVEDAPLVPPPGDGAAVEQIIVGTRTWVAELAAIAEPAERERMLAFFDASLAALERRLSRPA
ncbi:MAG TPA: CehA/McbA family metallohydrolase, partial [Candidatus Limnocylindrales bacterium]